MSYRKITGTGIVSNNDFKCVKWVGKSKAGNPLMIILPKAINIGTMEWAYADKGETTNEIVFTGVYEQKKLDAGDISEPFELYCDSAQEQGSQEIILGAGVFSIDDKKIGLTRGGGKFSRNATFRSIECDGDRGDIEGRIVMDEARPTLSMTAVELITRVTDLYPALVEEQVEEISTPASVEEQSKLDNVDDEII